MDNLDLQLSNLLTSRWNTQSSEQIPVDIIIYIFSRLPAKSIARFRCLSKIWASIVRGPDFTELFLTRSSSRSRLLFNFQIDDTLFFFSSPQPQNFDGNSSLVAVVDHSTRFNTNGTDGICEPVNGLVCIKDPGKKDRMTMICNPSTGESITLPNLGGDRADTQTCFGYDPIEKQFKVFFTFMLHLDKCYVSKKRLVLTLGTGIWRNIENYGSQYPVSGGICINGVLYYPARNDWCIEASVIVSFDLRSEKFSYIDIPVGFNFGFDSTLINYEGKLGVCESKRVVGSGQIPDGSTGFLKLWIVDVEKGIWEIGVLELSYIWQNLPPETDLYFVGMTSRGEFVFSPFLLCDPFYLLFYTPGVEKLVKVEIKGLKRFKNHKVHTFINYIENVKLL